MKHTLEQSSGSGLDNIVALLRYHTLEQPTGSGLDNIVALLRYHTLEQPTDSGLDNIVALLRYHSHTMSSSDLSTMNHMIAIVEMCTSKFRYGEIQQIKPLPCCLLFFFTVEFK